VSSARSSGRPAARRPSRAARHRGRGRRPARGTRWRRPDPDQPGVVRRAPRGPRSPALPPPRRPRRPRRPSRLPRRGRLLEAAEARRKGASPGRRARPHPSAIEGSRAPRSGRAKQRSGRGRQRSSVGSVSNKCSNESRGPRPMVCVRCHSREHWSASPVAVTGTLNSIRTQDLRSSCQMPRGRHV